MQIRPAERSDLASMVKFDQSSSAWDVGHLDDYVRSFGVLKLAEEGSWLLGWVAYRKVQKLLVVDRLVVIDDPKAECGVALRLIRHLGPAAVGSGGIDIVLPDDQTELVKTLVSQGFSAALIRDYYGSEDAVALHKKL